MQKGGIINALITQELLMKTVQPLGQDEIRERDYYVKLDAVFIFGFSPWHHTTVHVPADVGMMALVHNEFFW